MGEKADQSTFPRFEQEPSGSWAMRGPKNIVRTAAEFALAQGAGVLGISAALGWAMGLPRERFGGQTLGHSHPHDALRKRARLRHSGATGRIFGLKAPRAADLDAHRREEPAGDGHGFHSLVHRTDAGGPGLAARRNHRGGGHRRVHDVLRPRGCRHEALRGSAARRRSGWPCGTRRR